MAARSERRRFNHPYPVVIEALENALPYARFRVESTDVERGKVVARTSWSLLSLGEVVTVHVGADDATSTSVVVDSSLRTFGISRWAHPRAFRKVWEALEHYLRYYYERV